MVQDSIVQLKQNLLKLLEEQAIQYSGAALADTKRRYKVRLYKLPEQFALLSSWDKQDELALPN